MDDRRRLVMATVFAPLIVPAVFVAFQLFAADNYAAMFLVAFFSTATAYVGTFVIGLPVFYGLRRARMLNLLSLSLAGVAGGVIMFFVFSLFLGFLLESSAPFEFLQALWGGALGLLVSLAFGAFAGITWRSSERPKTGVA